MNFRDGYLVVGQPLGALPQDVVLTADNQVVLLSPQTALLRLQSDNTTAANRTFTITNGYLEGQELTIALISGSSTKAQLNSSGNCVLSAAWEPDQYDTIKLQWISGKWLQIARSANS